MEIFEYVRDALGMCFQFFQLQVFDGVPIWFLYVAVIIVSLGVTFVISFYTRGGGEH